MTTAGSVERKVWTEAELQALPDNGCSYEVVDGELVMTPKNGAYHADICAWIINPDTEYVEVCHAPDKRKLLGPGADLDGEHLLTGFRYPIAELFKGWDWE